jgi:glycerol uptake facilitator-like aquaporin
MAGGTADLARIERAIFLVGSVILIVMGMGSVAASTLNVYDYFDQFHNKTVPTPIEVNWTLGFLIGAFYLIGGLVLLVMASRVLPRTQGTA